jgi:hypothetical protein
MLAKKKGLLNLDHIQAVVLISLFYVFEDSILDSCLATRSLFITYYF